MLYFYKLDNYDEWLVKLASICGKNSTDGLNVLPQDDEDANDALWVSDFERVELSEVKCVGDVVVGMMTGRSSMSTYELPTFEYENNWYVLCDSWHKITGDE